MKSVSCGGKNPVGIYLPFLKTYPYCPSKKEIYVLLRSNRLIEIVKKEVET